jgi:uncharacterized glyoxalase superfamily protein PhnB
MAESWSEPCSQFNRSAPPGIIIPVLNYPDVRAAAEWLCRAFGFTERLKIGTHRVQLTFGGVSVLVGDGSLSGPSVAGSGHSVLIRVADVDAHHANAVRHGARIVREPADYPYGERQYTAEDLGGHRWTFSQTIADVDPATWGGELVIHPSPLPAGQEPIDVTSLQSDTAPSLSSTRGRRHRLRSWRGLFRPS